MGVRVRIKPEQPHLGYWVIITHNGQRWSKLIGDKRSADKFAREVELELGRGSLNLGSARSLLLGPYFDKWLNDYARVHCKPSTVEQYEVGWQRYIKPLLGTKPLASISRSDIRTVIRAMQEEKKSRNTIKAYIAPLSACLNQAIEDELIAKNPAFRIFPKIRGEEQSKIAQPLSEETLSHLLDVCRRSFPARHPMLLMFARTGMRIGEVIATHTADLDFARHVVHVRRTYAPAKNRYLGEDRREKPYSPKSGRYRSIPLSEELEATLQQYLRTRSDSSPLLFPNQVGKMENPNNFRRRDWTRLFIKAGLPRVRVHDLRHTFATQLIERGVSLAHVKEILGHHSIKVTVDLYSHLVPAKYRDVVNLLDHNQSADRAQSTAIVTQNAPILATGGERQVG